MRLLAWIVGVSFYMVIGGCGSRSAVAPETRAPSPATRTLVEAAEEAQLRRRYDLADQHYRQARTQAPDDVSRSFAALAHGRALIFWGEYARAEALLVEVCRLTPEQAGAWHDLGMLRYRRGDMAAAERAFARAMAAAPADARPRIALAALFWRQRRFAEALHAYEALRALALPAPVRDRVEWAIDTLRRQPETSR